MPTNVDLPGYVREEFGRTYQAIFDEQVRREGRGVVFTEYFWDMGWCDPCAAEPAVARRSCARPARSGCRPTRRSGGAQPAMVTRLHLRYTRDTLPEDLAFQETADRTPWQVRYVLRTPWAGDENACPAARPYFDQVRERQEREAATLASLTGRRPRDDPHAHEPRPSRPAAALVGIDVAGEAMTAMRPHVIEWPIVRARAGRAVEGVRASASFRACPPMHGCSRSCSSRRSCRSACSPATSRCVPSRWR